MTLETNFSRNPYFNTFDANNNFYQVLFRPRVGVQAREMNEFQSIAQDQIEKFGKHIFLDGSVVDGCNLSFNNRAHYVKILDNYSNGTAITVGDLNNFNIRNELGVVGKIYETVPGYVSQSPDLNTIFINYTSANGDNRVFASDQLLTVFNNANAVIGQVVVANSATSGTSNSVGLGYVVNSEEGVIFQKGYFIRVERQTLILNKYNNVPDSVSVGFKVEELIETPESNTALLDNAAGSPNFAAPGAHRLRLVPKLTYRSTVDTSNTQPFFSIADFSEGFPSIVRTDPAYANLGKQMAERTYEESGNYVINPFSLRLDTRYNSNNAITPEFLKLEVDPGLAYVNGFRVETVGKFVSSVRRGNDVKFLNQAAITASIGNHVVVNEFAGFWPSNGTGTISLRNAVTRAVSTASSIGDSPGGLSPGGTEIGTANLLIVRTESGNPGEATSKYLVYLHNIKMKSGRTFAEVRSLYTLNNSAKGFADIVLDGDKAVLKDPTLQSLVYPYEKKGIKTLSSFSANVSSEFVYRASSTVNFATSGVATLTIPSVTGGINQFPYTGTLTSSQEKEFMIVASSSVESANLSGYIAVAENANVITGIFTSFVSQLTEGQLIKIANSTASEYRRVTEVISDTSIRIANAVSQPYTGANVAIQYLSADPVSIAAQGASISIAGTTATINLGKQLEEPLDAVIYYNIRRTSANPLKKTLVKDIVVKLDIATSENRTNGPWCLGIPDVHKIKHVYVGLNYSTDNPDLSANFFLDNGQRDAVYGLAYLNKKPGVTIFADAKIIVVMDAFLADASQGAGYYCVDSYPIDDTGVAPNTIRTQDIPIYNSDISGGYDLRDAIDFRIRASNTVVITSNTALSNINPSSVLTVSPTYAGFVPAPDSSFEADIEYYVGRYDKIGIDPRGLVKVVEGTPSENPSIPADIPSMLTLASVFIPPYPSLAPTESAASKRYDYTTNISYYKNRRYTMRDIASLDQRLEKLEYYTALSVLELSTKSLMIESTTGGSRFQNGILADPFQGHNIGNVFDPQYSIAIDSETTEARPSFKQTLINSGFSNTESQNTKLSDNGRLISLPFIEKEYVNQPFANKVRNCAQDNMYIWAGKVTLSPEGDWMPDITVNPAVVVNLDLYDNFKQLSNAWGTNYGNWVETRRSPLPKVWNELDDQAINIGTGTLFTQLNTVYTQNQWIEERTNKTLTVNRTNNSYDFGSYVTDMNIQPYLRSKAVKFKVTGMKPNSRVYAFFDEVDVNQYCIPTDAAGTWTGGNQLITDQFGAVNGIFYIPAKTFFVGERIFKLIDVASLAIGEDNIQSRASAKYFGSNVSYAKNNVTLATSEAQLSSKSLTEQRLITTVDTQTNFSSNFKAYETPATSFSASAVNPTNFYANSFDPCIIDPIMQTFFIKEGPNVPGVFVNSIDVFFAAKHPTLGVSLEIREVFNGYPGLKVMPNSFVYKTSNQVNVSSNGTAITKFTFAAPVFLENDKEYCFVIMPDGSNPEYSIWVAEQGGKDIATDAIIFKNSGIGVMFTSSNNRTWTPFQKEDIKFRLHRCSFTALSGTAVLTNDNSEYITTSSILGDFGVEETVYFSNNQITENAVVATATTTVTNVATAGISSNTLVYLQNSTGVISEVRRVVSVVNSTAFVVNATPSFSDNYSKVGTFIGNGALKGNVSFIDETANTIVISNSTASTFVYTSANNLIIGENSKASARVHTVDDKIWSIYMPKFSVSVPPGTAMQLNVVGMSKERVYDTVSTAVQFDQEYSFIDKERMIMSKSNEVRFNSGNKSLKLSVKMISIDDKLTPIIDTIKSDSLVIQNIISDYNTNSMKVAYTSADGGSFQVGDIIRNNSNSINGSVIASTVSGNSGVVTIKLNTTSGFFSNNTTIYNSSNTISANASYVEAGTYVEQSETFPGSGAGKARYISRKVVLAEGLDAEDMKLYVSAYKPLGTDVYVYIKVWNSSDPDLFEEKMWTQLFTTNTLISSKANPNDFIEYLYEMPSTPSQFNTAYLNNENSGIIRYVRPTGDIYDSFKAFAVKIVLVSNDSSLVPRIQDYRALAVSI